MKKKLYELLYGQIKVRPYETLDKIRRGLLDSILQDFDEINYILRNEIKG